MNEKAFLAPEKSAYSLEYYDSDKERDFMDYLEDNSKVRKWTKNHGIRIPYYNLDGRLAHYTPDFLVEYIDGGQEIVEIKGKHLISNPITIQKSRAAQEWCEKRGIKYTLKEV